jgi:hypothetical protein
LTRTSVRHWRRPRHGDQAGPATQGERKTDFPSISVDYELVIGELHDLARATRLGGVVTDDATRRQMERLVASVQRLVRAHDPGSHGRCRQCGGRHHCPVHDLLVHYSSAWLGTTAAPVSSGIRGGL